MSASNNTITDFDAGIINGKILRRFEQIFGNQVWRNQGHCGSRGSHTPKCNSGGILAEFFQSASENWEILSDDIKIRIKIVCEVDEKTKPITIRLM